MSDPQRRCIATGQIREKEDLLRFAVSPEGHLVHDIQKNLPGRGIWISCRREAVELALKKRLFAKSAKQAVTVPADLSALIDRSLSQQCLALLGLGRKGGLLTVGFAKVERALKSGKAAFLIAASDGAEDGRQKLKRIAGDLPVIDIFSGAELSQALGKENLVHASMGSGRLATRILKAVSQLSKFRNPLNEPKETEVSE
ncbi:RNA-binding protein [Sneathiella sp.]|uniref:RNA-binding protein n=1 Tax=Sneathiella sp. TaxID=1964365 RepID=UPI003568F9F8